MFLKLLYWNRHRLYGEHLVVAFHAQTAVFIFALISAIPLGDWFGLLIFVLVIVQGFVGAASRLRRAALADLRSRAAAVPLLRCDGPLRAGRDRHARARALV